ncbi:unannotated protein [freshwater metagenome]|uniref:Unannotated protein n=1 Tax=freshwater metagenome TaxID=449393 RepID=A0A6J7G2X0_9ZZZZ
MFDIDALNRTNALGKIEYFTFTKGFGGEPTAIFFPDDRIIQTFFNGGPDRETWRECIPVYNKIRTIADTNFIDFTE